MCRKSRIELDRLLEVLLGERSTYSSTRLAHNDNHPSCTGIPAVSSHLWIGSGATGCDTSASGSAIPTDSGDDHSVDAERECTVYLCTGSYRARGHHRFNGAQFASSWGNNTTGGECNSGGGGGGHDQDPCDCQSCGCSPLILDLGRDGFHFSSAHDGVLFEIGPPGRMFWVGWPVSPDDAWLALDRDKSGAIENASELFGTSVKLASGAWARHGFEALAEFDSNLDGQIDANDPIFDALLVWSDANRNGVSEPGELHPLSAAGIVTLSTRYHPSRLTDHHGNAFLLRSEAGATTRPSVLELTDVFPAVEVAPQ